MREMARVGDHARVSDESLKGHWNKLSGLKCSLEEFLMLWTDRPIQNSVEGTIMRVEALVPGDSIVDYLKRRNNPCSRSRNLFVYFVDDRRFSINLFPMRGGWLVGLWP